MESIEQMIKRLCPKGVEWKKISEIGTVMRGTSFQKKHFTDEGTPCIHYGQIYTQYAHHVYETFSFVGEEISRSPRRAKTGALIMATTSENIEDVGKCIVWLGEKDIIVSNDACFIQHSLNPKYLGYLLQTDYFNAYKKKVATGTKVIRINADAVADFVIPVPPLEIQSRIVEVLDKMATLTAELEAELKAELEARKQQYEYYRGKLLTFNEIGGGGNRQVAWKKISEICVLKAGKTIKASELSDIKDSEHQYPCYGGNGIRGYIAKYSHEGRYAIIGRQGALCGCVNWVEGKFYATEHAVVCTPKTLSDTRFLYFLFTNENLNRYKSQGAQPGLSVANLNNIMLPIPPLSEQQRIVSILDRFEALTTDLQSGLPAEIEARRQQYEYYRNKLLTFETV